MRARSSATASWRSTPIWVASFGHFYPYAPTRIEYAIDPYPMAVKRQLDVLNQRLAGHEYLTTEAYTVSTILHDALTVRRGRRVNRT